MTKYLTKPKDKLAEGDLGVSIAKTPFMILLKTKRMTPKASTLCHFFMTLLLFSCVILLSWRAVFVSFFDLCILNVSMLVVCIYILLRRTLICSNNGNRNMKRNIDTIIAKIMIFIVHQTFISLT